MLYDVHQLVRSHFDRMDWILLAVYVAVFAPLATVGIWWAINTPYQTTAVIRVISEPVAQTAFNRSPCQLLTHLDILSNALSRQDVAEILKDHPDPEQWLQSHLGLASMDDDTFLQLSLWGVNPRGLDLVLNAVQEAYFEEVMRFDWQQRLSRLDELARRHEATSKELRFNSRQMEEVDRFAGCDSIYVEAADHRNRLDLLQDSIKQLETEIRGAQCETIGSLQVSLVAPATPASPVDLPIRMGAATSAILATAFVAAYFVMRRNRRPSLAP